MVRLVLRIEEPALQIENIWGCRASSMKKRDLKAVRRQPFAVLLPQEGKRFNGGNLAKAKKFDLARPFSLEKGILRVEFLSLIRQVEVWKRAVAG